MSRERNTPRAIGAAVGRADPATAPETAPTSEPDVTPWLVALRRDCLRLAVECLTRGTRMPTAPEVIVLAHQFADYAARGQGDESAPAAAT